MSKLKVSTVLPVFTRSQCFSSIDMHNLSVAHTVLFPTVTLTFAYTFLANETLCDLEAIPDSTVLQEHFKPDLVILKVSGISKVPFIL